MTTDFCPLFTIIPSDDIPTEGISDSRGIKEKVQENYDKWANDPRHTVTYPLNSSAEDIGKLTTLQEMNCKGFYATLSAKRSMVVLMHMSRVMFFTFQKIEMHGQPLCSQKPHL